MATLRYPVPKACSTFAQFRSVMEQMLEASEFKRFDQEYQKFISEDVFPEIDKAFESFAEGKDNWATENFKKALLSLRFPIPASTAMASVLEDHLPIQLEQAAILLHAAAQIKLHPEILSKVAGHERGEKMETTQQNLIFSTSRVPGKDSDQIKTFPDSKHAVILHKDSVFKVNIITDEGEPVPLSAILHSLEKVVKSEKHPKSATNFSGGDRNEWNNIRNTLIKHGAGPAFEELESSVLCLVLEDKTAPKEIGETLELIRCGEGCTSSNSQRYYDKVVNMVVFQDGVSGIIMEHTCVDGFIAGMFQIVLSHIASSLDTKRFMNNNNSKLIEVEPLDFHLDKVDISNISDRSPDDCLVQAVTIPFPPDVIQTIKEQRLIDPWMNFSIQLALKHSFGNLNLLMVEPTHVRRYIDGRSDPTYPITHESKMLIDAFTSGDSQEKLLMAFVAAVKEHKQKIKKTKQGQAFGPHIGVLREIMSSTSFGNKADALMPYLKKLQVPDVYITGSEIADGIKGILANVYAPNQLSAAYLVKKSGIQFVFSGKGMYQQNMKTLTDNLKQAVGAVLQVALPYAVAGQMGALPTLLRNEPSPNVDGEKKYAIALHGGAGEAYNLDHNATKLIKFAMHAALSKGESILADGGSSLDAVQSVVACLEDCFLFNAGKGAVFNSDGRHELEACIIDGSTKKCGAVACVRTVKNPIQAARAVMDKTSHVLLVGENAEQMAKKFDLKSVPNAYFSTDFRRQHLESAREVNTTVNHPQTVGAVAVDIHGKIAAASSTGGRVNKMGGRVGDTAITGAGLYADSEVAVACSGDGEIFLRNTIAHNVAKLMEYKDMRLGEACKMTLEEKADGHVGGIIGIDKSGNIEVEFNCQVMFVAHANSTGDRKSEVMIKNEKECKKENSPQLWVDESVEVLLHHSPCTPGVTVLTLEDHAACEKDVFHLNKADYLKLMLSTRKNAHIIQEKLSVNRCAMIASVHTGYPAHAKLIPLHGLSDAWTPQLAEDKCFSEIYAGYVSTHDGPRAEDTHLKAIQEKIRSANESAGHPTSFKFDGDASNSNLFAKLVRGEIEQWRIWEDDKHVAFLTPFPNTPGFTVIAPRKHLPSDIFCLEEQEYTDLLEASYEVASLLKSAFKLTNVAMAFEGYEVDYAHVKLIPIHNCDQKSQENSLHQSACHFNSAYQGFLTSKDGPKANNKELMKMHSLISCQKLTPPRSWETPEKHAVTAIHSKWYQAIFQLQNTLFHETINFFNRNLQYNYVITPLTTDCISSPMGLGSDSEPVEIDLFGQNTYLADSMQFTLEYYLRMQDDLAGTYYIAPSFRGEDPDSSHLNQFYHAECELLGNMDDAIRVAEGYLYHLTKTMLAKHKEAIVSIAGTAKHAISLLKKLEGNKSLPRITVDEAIPILPSDDCYEWVTPDQPECGRKLTREGERFLIEKFGGAVWLTEMDHLSVPFYQAYTDDTKRKSKAADLLIGLGETLGLGERHATVQEVQEALDHHTIPHESYQWYMDMRDAKSLKTSGWGMGTERYMCWLLKHDDVRDLHIIPRMKSKKFLP